MAKLYYQGHGSFRLTSSGGAVIFVDPYAGDGYDIPADIVLVTHQHGDHNQTGLITPKPETVFISNEEALTGGVLCTFNIGGITVEAVQACNKNHDPAQCVGYIITIDGKKVYAAGDTSVTGQMKDFSEKGLDWALLPCDGVYNMDLDEAVECAALIGAKHVIPYHIKPGHLFDRERAESFNAPNRVIVEPGEEIEL